jgi:hypothetical protein
MVSGLYKKLSPEVIRNELLNVQISILKNFPGNKLQNFTDEVEKKLSQIK